MIHDNKIGKGRVFQSNIDRLGVLENVKDPKDCCKKCQQTYWDTEIFDFEELYDTCHCAKTNKWKTGERVSTTTGSLSFAGLCGKYSD